MSTPRFSSGAVTMKMISSTSITSMYGTTLISALSLRLRWRRDGDAGHGGFLVLGSCWSTPEPGHAGYARRGAPGAAGSRRTPRRRRRSARPGARPWWRSGCRPTPPGSRRTGPSRWRSAPRRCPARPWRWSPPCTLARPWNEIMMPNTVPNRPTYGLIEPTLARNSRLCSRPSISREPVARIARCAPSSCMRAVDAAALAQAVELAEAGFEDRLHAADCRGRARWRRHRAWSVRRRTRSAPRSARLRVSARSSTRFLRKMITHDATEATSSSTITSCTGRLACSTSCSRSRLLPAGRRRAAALTASSASVDGLRGRVLGQGLDSGRASPCSSCGVSCVVLQFQGVQFVVQRLRDRARAEAPAAAPRRAPSRSSSTLVAAADLLREHHAGAPAFAQRDA